MSLFAKIVICWLLLDVAILSTVWYAVSAIRPQFPDWWKANICDDMPTGRCLTYHQAQKIGQGRSLI